MTQPTAECMVHGTQVGFPIGMFDRYCSVCLHEAFPNKPYEKYKEPTEERTMREKSKHPNKCSNCLGDQWEFLEPPANEAGGEGCDFTFMAFTLKSPDGSRSVNVAIDLWMCQSCGHIVQMGLKYDTPVEAAFIDVNLREGAEVEEHDVKASE